MGRVSYQESRCFSCSPFHTGISCLFVCQGLEELECCPTLLNVSCSVVSNSLWPPLTVTHQAPLSMGFPSQEYWSGLPFSSPGDLPDPGIEPRFPTLQADSVLSESLGKPHPNLGLLIAHSILALSSTVVSGCHFLPVLFLTFVLDSTALDFSEADLWIQKDLGWNACFIIYFLGDLNKWPFCRAVMGLNVRWVTWKCTSSSTWSLVGRWSVRVSSLPGFSKWRWRVSWEKPSFSFLLFNYKSFCRVWSQPPSLSSPSLHFSMVMWSFLSALLLTATSFPSSLSFLLELPSWWPARCVIGSSNPACHTWMVVLQPAHPPWLPIIHSLASFRPCSLFLLLLAPCN